MYYDCILNYNDSCSGELMKESSAKYLIKNNQPFLLIITVVLGLIGRFFARV